VVHGERESLTDPEQHADPHALLFGQDPQDDGYASFGPGGDGPKMTRRDTRRAARAARDPRGSDTRHHRRAFLTMTAVIVAILLVVGWVGYTKYENRYHPKDFATAAGTATVLIKVGAGDGADAIGATLYNAKVVASVRAFANAAAKNSQFSNVQPGTYRVHVHMSAKDAVSAILTRANRISNDVVVFEGATVFDVAPQLAKALGVSLAKVTAAINRVGDLNLPAGYTGAAGAPTSVEGFLYPATYTFDAGTSPTDALTKMISNFIDQDRTSHFAADAKAANLSPYEALIVASIAEKEAKVAADYPKVARVILNRIAAHMPLQIDATSAYAAKQRNLDPTKVIYATIDSPYNTYTHDGLPPTPIASPGATALAAAVNPAAGNWLYYVNRDAAGDLFFTNNDAAFEQAVTKCRTNHWGCG
jgi:UPF0755 protein